jgi:cysteine desulfurase/selenocysteine lyase
MHVYYHEHNANVHRGVHHLSVRATSLFELAREVLRKFWNAKNTKEIIWTKGCTEAINLVAHSWGRAFLKEGDEILLSTMEHHANIVPWQITAQMTGAKIKSIPLTPSCEIDLEAYERMLSPRTKLVGIVHASNALGVINPVKEMIQMAHKHGAKVLVDGAQSCAHFPIDVQDLDADFYTLSGHKVYGPTGIGALYAKQELLEQMPPYQAGGDMIHIVSFEKTTYADLPNKFEPGTPNIAGVIGLAEALEFIQELGWDWVRQKERELTSYAFEQLCQLEGLKVLGPAEKRTSVISFVLEGVHPHDIGTVLDQEGVAIRAGHHCCMPLMSSLGISATSRASMAIYNTFEEIDTLIRALRHVKTIFT